MHIGLLNSLLELAHATSQNLDFAHQKGANVSYGEETITETNLLELRRRHPGVITLRTFGKKAESKNGADWEWHIIGRARRFGMRVQAKRLQQNNVLKIAHVVKSSKAEQIDLLIADAKASGLMPIYCFYASEKQRSKWKASPASSAISQFEFGCLLACAHHVRRKMPKSLIDIESHCIPWHYLVDQRRFQQIRDLGMLEVPLSVSYLSSQGLFHLPIPENDPSQDAPYPDFPTIDGLNRPGAELSDREGIIEGTSSRLDVEQSAHVFQERRVSRVIEIDVRDFPLNPESDDPPSEDLQL